MDRLLTLLVVFGTIAAGAFLNRQVMRRLGTRNRNMDLRGLASSLSSVTSTEKDLNPSVARALDVIPAYGSVLEKESAPGIPFHPESLLPYTKSEIRNSIELLLLAELDETRRNHLEGADVLLNNFIPDEEYKAIQRAQEGLSQALQMRASGERDTLKLARALVEGSSSETDSLLKEIQDRVAQANLVTLRQHRALRLVAEPLKKAVGRRPEAAQTMLSGRDTSLLLARLTTKAMVVLLALAAVAAFQLIRLGPHGRYFLLLGGSVLSMTALWAYGARIAAEQGRPRRSIGGMLIGLGGFIPYSFGCYLVFYEGLWRLRVLFDGFSIWVVLIAGLYGIGGYTVVNAIYKVSELDRAISEGRLKLESK